MIPILNRGHIFSFREESDEVGFVIEAAVVTDLRSAELCVCKQVASFCHPQIIDVCDERDIGLSLEEMTECRVGHIH